MIESVNIIVFLWYIVRYFGYNRAIRQLQRDYGCKNLSVRFFGRTLWILSDRDLVESVLMTDADAKLTFMNRNFFASHPHDLGIGNIDYEQGECLWKGVHDSMASAIGEAMHSSRLETIMNKHRMILIGKTKNTYNLSKVLEKFITAVWSEFCFGNEHGDMLKRYAKMRRLYLKTINDSFYNSRISRLPFIGWLFCRVKRFTNRMEYATIDREISNYITTAGENSLFMDFEFKFREYNEKHNVIATELINKLVLDNAFLSVLALDFIDIACREALLEIAVNNVNDSDGRKKIKDPALQRGFLFPWRGRYMPHDHGIFKAGDYVLVNLIDAKHLFSYGPRACVGPRFFNKFYTHLLKILEPFRITLVNTMDPIVRDPDENRPFIISKHIVKLLISPEYLQHNLKSSEHKGVVKFYHVHEITQNPMLYRWIVNELVELIRMEAKVAKIDGIVSAEARGWLFAGPVATNLGLPLFTVRKEGKLPGTLFQQHYQKEGYDGEEVIEIQTDINDKTLIIIDDGIASGITTKALYDLVSQGRNTVPLICNVIRHTYTPCQFNPDGVKMITLFDL
jgi:adenine phosphoribosyltransferase